MDDPIDPDDDGPRMVVACPDCDHPDVRARNVSDDEKVRGVQPKDGKDYICKDCGATFDDPVERPARGDGPLSDLGQKLSDMDPDDI